MNTHDWEKLTITGALPDDCKGPMEWMPDHQRRELRIADRDGRLLLVSSLRLIDDVHLELKTRQFRLGIRSEGKIVYAGGADPDYGDPSLIDVVIDDTRHVAAHEISNTFRTRQYAVVCSRFVADCESRSGGWELILLLHEDSFEFADVPHEAE